MSAKETNILYSMFRTNESQEHHLFIVSKVREDGNTLESHSICQRVEFDDRGKKILSAVTSEIARKKAYEIGKAFCGTCISHLYASYK